MVTLDDLANKYQTDKGSLYADPTSSRHGYASIYDERYLSKWRNEDIRLLEIGISLEPSHGGQSVNMWYDYFTKAKIFTMDILDMHLHPCVVGLSDRVRFFQADQGNRDQLAAMYKGFGSTEFDFILEDGSHQHDHQMISFGHLFKYVKSKGYYILEDMSILDHEVCCIRNDDTFRAIQSLADTGKIDSKFLLPEEKAYIESNIKSIDIHADIQDAYAVAIITKK